MNITFHHAYSAVFFTQVFRENWRDLKGLLREIRHRRGRAGAAFNLTFIDKDARLVFRSGLLDSEEMSSAIDQVGHLTSIINRITGLWEIVEPFRLIECSFDKGSDRWHNFIAFTLSDEKRVYIFDDEISKWTRIETSLA